MGAPSGVGYNGDRILNCGKTLQPLVLWLTPKMGYVY